MTRAYPIREAAGILGVSDDTLRRWVDAGRVEGVRESSRRMTIDGAKLADLAEEMAATGEHAHLALLSKESARNRLTGLVTRVVRDTVMAQVEMQAGPYRIVSLMSREAADDLGLEPGVTAIASVKSTNVVVEVSAP